MAKPTILTFWPTYVVDITGIVEIVGMKGGNWECYDWMAKWLQNSTSRVARANDQETYRISSVTYTRFAPQIFIREKHKHSRDEIQHTRGMGDQ